MQAIASASMASWLDVVAHPVINAVPTRKKMIDLITAYSPLLEYGACARKT
jgi:hypothetical protein